MKELYRGNLMKKIVCWFLGCTIEKIGRFTYMCNRCGHSTFLEVFPVKRGINK